ncbi:MAG: ThuA domain-containing protein [Cyclobacteriaceae bacterium]|jgi:hypothetical protein
MKKLILLLIPVFVFPGCTNKSRSQDVVKNESKDEPMMLFSLAGNPEKPLIVFVTGDEEYRSEEGMPQIAKILNQHHGFNCIVLFAQDPDKPGIVNPNYLHNIPGLENLLEADLMVIFTRFRALPDAQMKWIDDYLKSGKPVLGIRTATHAFNFTEKDSLSAYHHYGNFNNEEGPWKGGFGRLILGEKWISHHGDHGNQSTRGLKAEDAGDHPIWNGIEEGSIWGPTDVYGVRLPLPGDARPIVLGQCLDRSLQYSENDPRLGMRPNDSDLPEKIERMGKMIDQNDPMMPIAWTKSYQIPGGREGKSFTSTIGASADLLEAGTRRLIVNAAFWLLDLEVPDKANVELVGHYSPTAFGFKDDDYWDQRNILIANLK